MDKFRKDFTYLEFGIYYWRLGDSRRKIRAKPPKNFER
jgi:hypothetical protein